MSELKLSPKQWEYIANAHARWNIKTGAVRSGKSFVDTAYVIVKRLMAVRGKDGLNVIFGVSLGTIERNVLQPMRERYGDAYIGSLNQGRGTIKIFGEEVYCIGVEKVSALSKVQGMSLKYAYGDEIAKWSPEVFAMIESRLDKEYSCFDGTCNPESPNHWFKKFLEKSDLDIYQQQYVLFDNPFLPKSFVENLCAEYKNSVYYDRYILGKWALAEGLVYPMYDNTVPTVDRAYTEYYISMDYGTLNPTAMLLWGLYDGVWYAVKEYYHSGRDGVQKTDEQYYQELDKLAGDLKINRVYIDPSAASFITTVRQKGKFRVQKADNTVLDGIRRTAAALETRKVLINDCCTATIREFGMYSWDEKSESDAVIKENDHCMDALRYFVQTKRIWRNTGSSNFSSIFG